MSGRPQRNRKAPERFEFSPNHKVYDDYGDDEHSSEIGSNEEIDVSDDSRSQPESDDSDFVVGEDQEEEEEEESSSSSIDSGVSDSDEPDVEGDSSLSDVLNSADYEGTDSEEAEDDEEASVSADLEEDTRGTKRASTGKNSAAKRQKK
jgi:hypothetical protein